MKKTMKALAIILFVATSTFMGCKKDKDPCEGVTCKNGGTCVNGSCSCPTGYMGTDCGTQRTPSKITITKISVTKFPLADGSNNWDLICGPGGTLPDIFPKLYLGTTLVYDSPTTFTDASTSLPYEFALSPSIDLTSPTSKYSIYLYDYDDCDADDFMGGIDFTPYSSTGGFPTTLTVDAGGGVAFKLSVTYTF